MFDKLTMQTKDLAQENIKKLADLFPECVTESKDGDKTVYSIDFDVLKKLLGDSVVEGYKEKYQFTWPDKSKTMDFLLTPSTKTLRPCRAESVDFDHTKNLYIEGDNLEVLKLMGETYHGKVKMIYIDPPYNTGNDFIYKDNFKLSNQDYSKIDGNYSDTGECLVENPPSNGRFHTDWLNMIYPRLMMAKEILREDGVIFVSIDDCEVDNLSKMMTEIFGESNFVCKFIWKSKLGKVGTTNLISTVHEYILCYAKQIQKLSFKDIVTSSDGRKENLRQWGIADRREDRPSMFYPITIDGVEVYPIKEDGAEGRWRVGEEVANALLASNQLELSFKNGKYTIYRIFPPGTSHSSYSSMLEEIGTTAKGASALKSLGMEKMFDYSKPVELIQHFVNISTSNNDIIFDFFSGSATTAQAVLEQNILDGGNRAFIMVQLPEKIDADSVAGKQNYKTICEIGLDRIRKVGQKIKSSLNPSLDCGFRVLKLDSSNMNSVYYNPNEIRQSIVEYSVDNIKSDRTNEDLLFQAMIEFGIDLSSPISKFELCGKEVFDVDDGYLIACFDENISDEVITEIAKKKPVKFVIRDKSLASDSVAINFEQIFKTYSPNTSTKVL